MGKRRKKARQLTFDHKRWGGWREGAGRKRSKGSGVSHATRAPLAARFPVHVTMRIEKGLPSLRRMRTLRLLQTSMRRSCGRAGRIGTGFRVVHFSVQTNHVHLLVEATDRLSLSRGIQGLAVRMARGVNRLWDRTGKVFADRYHDRILRTPREVRRAVAYVLQNARKHGVPLPEGAIDYCSSGRWFEGWRERVRTEPEGTGPVSVARTWLLAVGWRRQGRVSVAEVPG